MTSVEVTDAGGLVRANSAVYNGDGKYNNNELLCILGSHGKQFDGSS